MKTSAISNRQVVLTLGLVLGLACAARAQTTASSGGPSEGITVHGHWVIDVRNADGSLASHSEFENALVTVGDGIRGNSLLAGILARQYGVIGDWKVVLQGADAPCGQPTFPQNCFITESTFGGGASNSLFKTLQVRAPTEIVSLPLGPAPVPTGTLEFTGDARASRNGAIAAVSTLMGTCPVGTNCFVQSTFTAHTLPTPISVVANQIIQVSVIVSFN